MKSIPQILAHRTAKEGACRFNGTQLNLKQFAQLVESADYGATFYIATEKKLFGRKGADFVSTREKTTSHGRFTPKGSQTETAKRFLATLAEMSQSGLYYGPQVEQDMLFLAKRVTEKQAVQKDFMFMRALNSVANAKPITPPAAQKLGIFAEKFQPFISNIGPETTAAEMVHAIKRYPLSLKERIADQLKFHIRQNIKIDPVTKKPDHNPIVDLLVQVLDETQDLIDREKRVSASVSASTSAASPVVAASKVDPDTTIGAFAAALQNVSEFKAGYQIFGEINDSTTVGELVENVLMRSPETQEVIKDVLSLITRESRDSSHVSMAHEVLSSMSNDASDPYADIDPADFLQLWAPIEWKASDVSNPNAKQLIPVGDLQQKIPLRQWVREHGEGVASPVSAQAAVPSITTTIPLTNDPAYLSGDSSSDDDSSTVDSH